MFIPLLMQLNAGPPPDVVEHTGPVSVIICQGTDYTVREVKRELRWWKSLCVVDAIGIVSSAVCPPYPLPGQRFIASPNTIYLMGDQAPPTLAGATVTLYSPDGPLSLIRFAHRFSQSKEDRLPLLRHELGHALAFDGTVHHSGPGTAMAATLDTMGGSTEGIDQCSP